MKNRFQMRRSTSRLNSTLIGTKSISVAALVLVSVLAGLFILRLDPSTTQVGISAVILASLVALNLRFSRTLLYPPAMFCAIWTILLTLLFLSGDYFYPISWKTLSFYVLGAGVLSLGGWMSSSKSQIRIAPIPRSPRDRSRLIGGVLTLSLIIFLAGVPFYWNYAQELASTSRFLNMGSMWAIRDALIKSGEESGVKSFSQFVFDSLSGYSILIVFVACLEDRVSRFQRFRYYALIAVALFFNLATAGRVGAFLEVIGLVILTSLRNARINFKLVGGGTLAFLMAFAPAAIWMNKGGDVTWSVWENVVGVSQAFLDYVLAGTVAFDRIIQNPNAIPPVWRISRSFLQIAGRMGFSVDVPSIHADFTPIRTGLYGNAYTMYFAYLPDFGWAGTMFLVFLLGCAVTYVYRKAIGGNKVYAMLYGLFGCYLVLSGFNENFFTQLNFNLKCIGLAWVLYSMPLSWRRKEAWRIQKAIERPPREADRFRPRM